MKRHIFMGALAMFLLGACGNHEHHDHSHEGHNHEAEAPHGHEEHNHSHEADSHGHSPVAEKAESHAHASDEIVLTPEKAASAGVKAETVEAGTFREVIPVSGKILAAQGDEMTVVAPVAGVVSFSRTLTEGMQVGGTPELMSISARNIQEGDPVDRAKIAYERAKTEYERAKKLKGSRIVSEKEYKQLEENFENARLAYEALAPDSKGRGVAVKAPMSGYVKSCMVSEGDYVTVGQPLMSITRSRRLVLRAEVSERYYSRLGGIASANFRTPYNDRVYRLDELNGRLLSYGKTTGDASFYLPVNFEFDNRGDIIPGSFVEVYLLSAERRGVISVPVSALTEEQGLNFVYLKLDAECYKKQEVRLGASDGTRVEVVAGLSEGDTVVTQGAIHVKLASASTAIPGHTHNH